MEEAVAGAVVGATIQVVLQNLLSFSVEQIGLIWNFNKDLQKMKDSFVMIRKFLEDAEAKQVTDKAVTHWLMKLEDVAFDADYVFDQLNYEVLRKKVETDHKRKKKVSSCFPNSKTLLFRPKMARKIKEIKNELKSINQEAMELGLQMRIAGAPARGARTDALTYLETDSFSLDPVFAGRENDVAKVVEMVTCSIPTEELVSVLPIVGMGGLGKTTLTRKVYNDHNIISHFEKRIWVHVSENFDPVIVLKSIVESSTGENVDGSREVVLQKLQKSLGDKKYLLVLDNVWNESNDKWGNFITSLKGISSMKGNVIIVTSRSGNVATIVKTLDSFELGVLSEEDCWFIIKSKAFGEGGIPSEFETIGANVAKRCGGLPLAAQVVGSLLRGKSKHEWVSIEQNWLSSMRGDGNIVSKILKLSFDHLPSASLKKCFAFCSIIPKGWWVEKDELIHYWMGEGLLPTDQETDMEIVGNIVFNILVQSSLLQVWSTDWYGNVECCKTHDLMHDLASSILNSGFLDGAYQGRYISRPSINESPPIPKEHAKCLRGLFFGGKISDTIFSNLKRLHVLILNDGEMKELPIEIGKLISLRIIDISHTRIECLPDSIGDLYHLQTFRAINVYGGESYLKRLPDTFKFLISLRHLYIPHIELPPEIGKLSSLRILPSFQVGDEEGCRIVELGSLKNLKGEMEIHNLEKVRDKEEAKNADLFHKTNILKLKFVWNKSRVDGHNNDEDVLDGLQPHRNLKSLEIEGFRGTSFPLWTLRMEVRSSIEHHWIKLDYLLELQLSNCRKCKEIPMMGHLLCLKFLYLSYLPNVESIGSSFYGINEDEANKEGIRLFPALEKLVLHDMEKLTSWKEVELSSSSRTQPREELVFCLLEYLTITHCQKLKSAPSHFPRLKELEIDNMESGVPLASICGSKLTALTKLKIREVDGAVSLPDELFNNNRGLLELDIQDCSNFTHLVPCLGGGGASLRKLEIFNCSKFEKLPEDVHKLNALEELKIERCLNLKVLPEDVHKLNALEVLRIIRCTNLRSIAYPSDTLLSSHGFTSLRHLEFSYCSELTNFPCEMLESCAISLETLKLTGSQSFTNLPQVMSILHKMSHLTELEIRDIPKLGDVVVGIGSLRSIKYLRIGGSSDFADYVSFDRIFPAFQSLRELRLWGMEEWDGLPNQLQHLSTLHELWLREFGIQVLPEWLERLSSLRFLAFWDCEKLRHLPSKKAMQGLTKLLIYDSPLLKHKLEQEGRDRDGSEWSKVSHIPYIWVDGFRLSV